MSIVDKADNISRIFKTWDQDGNGKISREELGSVMRELCSFDDDDLQMLLDEADTNKDGCIDYDEFVSWLMRPQSESLGAAIMDYGDALKPLFNCYDRDKSGSITFTEFEEIHSIMRGALRMHAKQDDDGEPVSILALNTQDSEKAFTTIDHNHDAKVSFTEFINWQKDMLGNSGIEIKQLREVVAHLIQLMEGIFKISETHQHGATNDEENERVLSQLIENFSDELRTFNQTVTRRVSSVGVQGNQWVEPPVGLNVERLKGTYFKSLSLNMRKVKSIQMEVMCAPVVSDEDQTGPRMWLGAIVARVSLVKGGTRTVPSMYYLFNRESFTWEPIPASQEDLCLASLGKLTREMKLFCFLKTEANFGIQLSWAQIQEALEGSVDMKLLESDDLGKYRTHMRKKTLRYLQSENLLEEDSSQAEIDGRIDEVLQKVVLRPRQVMGGLAELKIIKIHDEWKAFVGKHS
eukprot:TRINITY_DN44623_c0_g1_i1.p1 TRINITY_DN44623_c0_g1~~TRINITY_DN44623_c0_g1_i1.p1  ORF type:complete len:464 (-),score=67.77 TRINITY_DN44623_c0_g1_i1:209-1600(-)